MLSVAVISYNEADRIERMLQSVSGLADEIIVVDSGSIDETATIAKRYGAVVLHHAWAGYGAQKQWALEQCNGNWLLFLDADESLSPQLREEIRKITVDDAYAAAYSFNRRVIYLGEALSHAWTKEWQTRLVHRSVNPHWEGEVHESLKYNGKVHSLHGILWHYSYRNISEHFEKTIKYACLAAKEKYRKNETVRWYNLIVNPLSGFIRRYILELGFLDGIRGLTVGFSALVYFFLKYIFLWEMYKRKSLTDRSNE